MLTAGGLCSWDAFPHYLSMLVFWLMITNGESCIQGKEEEMVVPTASSPSHVESNSRKLHVSLWPYLLFYDLPQLGKKMQKDAETDTNYNPLFWLE